MPYTLFLTTLLFAPLAFGSVETWSIALVEILVFLTTLFFFFQVSGNRYPLYRVPGILPLLLLLFWIFLQLLPLPPFLVKTIAPGIYQSYAPILAIQDSNQWIPLTIHQKDTLLEFLRISSYVLLYFLTVQLLTKSVLMAKTVRIIAYFSIAIAFLAILQSFTSPKEIYWFRPTPSNAMGPWVNRNHYSGFMELVLPLLLTLFFFYRPTIPNKQSLRARLVSLISPPESNIRFFLGFGIVLILASVFIALSRGGIISITFGVFFFLFLRHRKTPGSGNALPLALLGTVFLAISWFGWDPILSRFNFNLEINSFTGNRLQVWQDCIPLIKNSPLTGSGFGSFVHIFPQCNTQLSRAIFDHAHNDYIELLTDGGLIAFLLAAWFVITILRHGLQQLAIRREPYSILLIIGALTAIFSFLLHSISDFNMHIGSNGLYFFFLCGLLVSAGNTRLRYHNTPTLLKTLSPKWKASLLFAFPLLLLTVTFQGGVLRANKLHQQALQTYINPQLSEKIFEKQLLTINKAIQADPLEGRYSYYKANLFYYLQQDQAAFENYFQAAVKDPMEGIYLQRLGVSLPPSEATKASLLMKESYIRSLNTSKEDMLFTWAKWHLLNNRKKEALPVLQQGLERFPGLTRKLASLLMKKQVDKEDIRLILPQRVDNWIQFGTDIEKLGLTEESEFYFRHALDYVSREETVSPKHFIQIYRFYMKRSQTDEAIAVLRQGIEWLPDHAPFHIFLGDYYKQQNSPYQAGKEYEKALFLDPENKSIQKRIQSLQ
ncbi:MAG: O-antigen ligase family protein [Desulfocapsa sp.]|nr:O-antigen ligase family protein [Desulfocapsa sp.]